MRQEIQDLQDTLKRKKGNLLYLVNPVRKIEIPIQ
jgi:hypothetical protein